MNDARRNSLAIWLLILTVGLVGVPLAGVFWHLTERWLQPPEEQRWANGDVSPFQGPHLQEVKEYSLPFVDASNSPGKDAPSATTWDNPNVAVYSAPDAKPPSAPVTLENLSNTGQAHAIDFMAKKADQADVAWSQLSKAMTGPDGGIERIDPYRADRVLVATVSRGLLTKPGDRLLWSRIFVQPINFEFAGYTVASTDTKTIKIASVENTDDSKLSLGFGLDAALSGASKDSQSPSVESKRKTTADINQEYENLGVDIRPNFLRIIRESSIGGDVVGNTAIHLSVLSDPQAIRHLDLNGTMAAIVDESIPSLVVDEAHLTDGVTNLYDKQAKIIVHPQDVLPHCPLIAQVWMIYEIRRIVSGNYHYLEGLQNVSLIQDGEPTHKVEIVRADDIAPAVWSIKRHKAKGNLSEEPDLRANVLDGIGRRVVSTDYATVSELTHWLKANVSREPLNDLTFDNDKDETLVPFKNVENDCQKKGIRQAARMSTSGDFTPP